MGHCSSKAKKPKNPLLDKPPIDNIESPLKDFLNMRLLYGIEISDFDIQAKSLIYKGGFGDVVRIPLKSRKEILAVKVISMNSFDKRDSNEMDKEINFIRHDFSRKYET